MNLAFSNFGLWPILFLVFTALIVHFLSKTPAKKLVFPAMQFILQAEKKSSRSTRLKHLWLLLIRTLLLLILLLAALLPFIPAQRKRVSSENQLPLYLMIDTTASMLAKIDGKTIFESSQKDIIKLIGKQSSDRPISLVSCGQNPKIISDLSFEHQLLIEKTEELSVILEHAQLDLCFSLLAEKLKAIHQNQPISPEKFTHKAEVIVFTDYAAHALQKDISLQLPKEFKVRVYKHLKKHANNNFAITLHPQLIKKNGRRLNFNSYLNSYSSEQDTRSLKLFYAATLKSQQQQVLSPLSTKNITFSSEISKEKQTQLTTQKDTKHYSITLLGNDAIEEDNHLIYPNIRFQKQNLLIVDGENHPSPYQDEIYFLQQVLLKSETLKQSFEVTIVNLEKLNFEQLKNAQVIVLANVRRLPTDLSQVFLQKLATGTGVLITSGDQIDIDWYNQYLNEYLPGNLRGVKEYRQLENPRLHEEHSLKSINFEHPIFIYNTKEEQKHTGLKHVQTHSQILIDANPSTPKETLMQLDNNNPLLLERKLSSGRLLFLTTSIDQEWSDLCIRPGFLPLIQSTLLYLGAQKETLNIQAVEAGHLFSVRLDPSIKKVQLETPSGQIKNIKISIKNQQNYFSYQSLELGIHKVSLFKNNSKTENIKFEFTTVFPHQESNLREFTTRDTGKEQGISSLFVRATHQKLLYPYLLLMLICVFFLESQASKPTDFYAHTWFKRVASFLKRKP